MSSCVSPDKNCDLCPRLEKFRQKNRAAFPEKFNAPVPSFGDNDPLLVVVGLAPGLKGANFSGRPFTGDSAGDLLYPALAKFGFAAGRFDRRVDDGLKLKDTRITNAVRCVPPKNKPLPAEINACPTEPCWGIQASKQMHKSQPVHSLPAFGADAFCMPSMTSAPAGQEQQQQQQQQVESRSARAVHVPSSDESPNELTPDELKVVAKRSLRYLGQRSPAYYVHHLVTATLCWAWRPR